MQCQRDDEGEAQPLEDERSDDREHDERQYRQVKGGPAFGVPHWKLLSLLPGLSADAAVAASGVAARIDAEQLRTFERLRRAGGGSPATAITQPGSVRHQPRVRRPRHPRRRRAAASARPSRRGRRAPSRRRTSSRRPSRRTFAAASLAVQTRLATGRGAHRRARRAPARPAASQSRTNAGCAARQLEVAAERGWRAR